MHATKCNAIKKNCCSFLCPFLEIFKCSRMIQCLRFYNHVCVCVLRELRTWESDFRFEKSDKYKLLTYWIKFVRVNKKIMTISIVANLTDAVAIAVKTPCARALHAVPCSRKNPT